MGTDADWQKWGQTDPYYGVLTDERFRAGKIAANRSAFFATGEAEIEQMLARYTRHFGDLPAGAALDFGCGVGRLTFPLAERFGAAVGLDISPAMLAEAERNAQGYNAAFRLSDDALSAAPGLYAFVNTFIVLQHIPCERGMAIVERLLDKVMPGGGCQIHISVRRRLSPRSRLAYFVRHRVPGGQYVVNLVTRQPLGAPPMQMNEYSLADLLRMFDRMGFAEVVVTTEDHGDIQTARLMSRRTG